MEYEGPRTAAELNEWMRSTFIVLDGARRAYIQFPVGNGAVIRRVFTTHGIVCATEHKACEIFYRELKAIPDESIILVRRPFEWQANYTGSLEVYSGYAVAPTYPMGFGMLSARLAFWDELTGLGYVKPEGAPALIIE